MASHERVTLSPATSRWCTIIWMGLILLYHRIADAECDPWSLCVSPRRFAEHLEIINKIGRPCTLRELVHGIQAGGVPPRCIAVTFDDGYVDNLHNAEPLLRRHGVPATFFVVSGFLAQHREFWWDELEALILTPGVLPATLRLTIREHVFEAELGSWAHYDVAAHGVNRAWRASGQGAPTLRHALYLSLYESMKPLTDAERRPIMDQLIAWAGMRRQIRDACRTLSSEQVTAMARHPLIDIESHTVTHPSLPALDGPTQLSEIRDSKTCLEELLGHPIRGLAYPYGSHSEETLAITKQATMDFACSTIPGRVGGRTEVHRLPRVVVDDLSGDEFEKRLSSWLGFPEV